ncbi:MAG: AMP-binding protein [Proteobacteria bacterium]|nr:AMP-binding protein [Pseudomonadota bacterium]
MTTGMTVAYHAQQAPMRMAVVTKFGERTFSALNARANQLARVFRQAGLKPDDGVAMLLVNRPEFLEVYYACMRSGLRITPINWHLSGDNAAYVVGNCEARAFIADIRCEQAALDALKDNSAQLKVTLAVGGEIKGFDDYGAAVDAQDDSDIENPEIGAQMLYTSGTTGRPKGVYRKRGLTAAGTTTPSPTGGSGTTQASSDTVTRTSEAAAWNAETDRALCTGPAYHAAPFAFNIIAPIAINMISN